MWHLSSPLPSTRPLSHNLHSEQPLNSWGTWGFLELEHHPCPLADSGQDPHFWGLTLLQPAEPSLPLTSRFTLFQVSQSDTGCVI